MNAAKASSRKPTPALLPTCDRILDAAEMLVQTRGFNGISYADIAGEVGVTKANLHHHFGSKAEMGEALLARYVERFLAALGRIDKAGGTGLQLLEAYTALYEGVVRMNRLCLCGVLAAEYDTLPAPMRKTVRGFFDANEVWLERVIRQGRKDGTLAARGQALEEARVLLAGLEGAMLITRPQRDYLRFKSLARALVSGLKGRPEAIARPRARAA
jgi:TetR/AcrR family transcriptional regulator, transcriptional repressor for nem operon